MLFRHSLLALTVTTVLTACGGSDSSSVDETPALTPPTTEPTNAPTTTEGVITGFGSVYVNGKRYISESASFTIAGQSGALESGLKVGMVVKVKASEAEDGEDPQASEFIYEETLQGAVSVIDRGNGQFTMMGQIVSFDDLTEFENIDPEQLTIGDIVEVSGYATETGFYATFVELETDETEFKLTGVVSALDTEQQTFLLGDLTVNYSQASFDDMTASDLSDGMMVKVEGVTFDAETMVLTAQEIENKEPQVDRDFADEEEIEIAGVVTSYNSDAGTFKVNRYDFTLSDETEFEDGTRADFAGNMWVKVEGSLQDGVLVADEVEFKKRETNSKTEGQVTEVNADANTFVINGITFTADAETQYEDESEQQERRFTFDDIAVNDILKVASAELEDGTLLALKVKRINEEDRDGEVKGLVTDLSITGITVAGVSVTFGDDMEIETDDAEITLDEFLALVEQTPALVVEVEGEYGENGLVATEIEVIAPESDENDEDEDSNKLEIEGKVESISETNITVAGYELRFDDTSELELNDELVSVEAFIAALAVGSIIEFSGTWVEDGYVLVTEAEAETETQEEDE